MDIEKLIGTTIEGRYRVLRELDQGGTSHILLAHHEELEIHVVLKVLSSTAENNDNLYAHSVQEGRLLARLHHPNIVRIYDRFRGAQLDAMVLEYIEGQNLARLSRGSPFAWNRACRLLLQCCAAVEALHEAGFLHRDLNPQNFMVQQGLGEADETIKLIDLGTAKHLSGQEPLADALELTTTIIPCTPPYISPEHARNELRGGSVAADTYGLAVTLYALVVGRPPWTTGVYALLFQQIGMEPAFIPENIVLPPALRELILRGLEKDPARRFATPAELAAAIRAVLKPRPLAVTGAPKSAPRLAARSRTFSAAAAAAVVAVIGVAAAVLMSPTDSAEAQQVRLLDPEHGPTPEPVPVTLAAALPAVVALPAAATLAAVVAPPASPIHPVRQLDPAAQLRRLAPRLRRCPSAPTGRVLFELDGRLARLDLQELDRTDPWHRCAAATLAAVTGTASVDLEL